MKRLPKILLSISLLFLPFVSFGLSVSRFRRRGHAIAATAAILASIAYSVFRQNYPGDVGMILDAAAFGIVMHISTGFLVGWASSLTTSYLHRDIYMFAAGAVFLASLLPSVAIVSVLHDRIEVLNRTIPAVLENPIGKESGYDPEAVIRWQLRILWALRGDKYYPVD